MDQKAPTSSRAIWLAARRGRRAARSGGTLRENPYAVLANEWSIAFKKEKAGK